MAIKFYSSLDLRTNQLKHALLHTDSSAPTSPTPAQGQIIIIVEMIQFIHMMVVVGMV